MGSNDNALHRYYDRWASLQQASGLFGRGG
jgi:hypothetical protein